MNWELGWVGFFNLTQVRYNFCLLWSGSGGKVGPLISLYLRNLNVLSKTGHYALLALRYPFSAFSPSTCNISVVEG